MQRFFVDPGLALAPGTEITLPPGLTHQVGRVLRLRAGARIVLLDNSGDESEVELTHFGRAAIAGRVLARRSGTGEAASPRVTLYQCLLKGEKFTWVLQKATELGVSAIVPVVSTRTLGSSEERGKLERWSRIVREAAEQSRRTRLPAVRTPLPWPAAIEAAVASSDLAIVPWEEAAPDAALRGVLEYARRATAVSLFIGPEGGLTTEEVALAAAAGARPVSLGPRILRAETAALAALALLLIPT